MPPTPMTDDELATLDRWWRAANYLSVGQIYLLGTRSPVPGAGRRSWSSRGSSATGARHPGSTCSGPTSAGSSGETIGTCCSSADPVTAARRRWRARGWRAATARSTPPSPGTARGWAGCSASSPFPAASRVTPPRRRPARSTREASSATRSPTPTAPPSTTPSCWSPVSSVTARPRPGRWRRRGTRPSSSTRRRTARSCRSCISTATRSPTRPCSAGSTATS